MLFPRNARAIGEASAAAPLLAWTGLTLVDEIPVPTWNQRQLLLKLPFCKLSQPPGFGTTVLRRTWISTAIAFPRLAAVSRAWGDVPVPDDE